ncbi:uncharacterized protein LOC116113389 isoform X2 [Pistacia vera]|uniref:uncharacterized protein LOC116113389 isoform X2 n=1 Tax=Pistacia vera TaxID=55513 RepID=UPI001263606F|nr:uncharacterized protein LOC116113389 isoform X2 [Pistacia vera]
MKLITPSTVRSLVQLKEMSVEECETLIEIVENEGDTTRCTEIIFNNLKKLFFRKLESLTCFCSWNYSFNFPSLEELTIVECPNMKTFSQEILDTPKLTKAICRWKNGRNWEKKNIDIESGLNTNIQQAYKKQKQVDSNLKELKLTLSGRDVKSIWQGEFQENFGKVKTLQLIKDEYANIPLQILNKFNSLEKLILKVSSYEEIFSFEEDKEYTGAHTKLKILEFWGLFNLKCISKQGSRFNSIFQSLHSLEVNHCHNLMTLLPSSTSFENLTTLMVSYCNGMQNLMSSSTAKSLVRLEDLSIKGCEMMIEVLAKEGDTEKVTECSKMKTFSRGGLSMPRLKYLNSRYCLESDIDRTIQQLQNDCSELWKRFPGSRV